jgi:hypothetical protein
MLPLQHGVWQHGFENWATWTSQFGKVDWGNRESELGKIPDQMVLEKHLLKVEFNIQNFKLVCMRVTPLKCYTETNKLCNAI